MQFNWNDWIFFQSPFQKYVHNNWLLNVPMQATVYIFAT